MALCFEGFRNAPIGMTSRACVPARAGDVLCAWVAATLLSGIPSTVYAWLSGGDVTEATRAAGAMLISRSSSFPQLLLAAALVHGVVSLAWAWVLVVLLPRRHTVAASVVAAVFIALLDLRVIAPLLFPEVAALAFWPQFADHVMWGLGVGAALHWRWRSRA
jgi:hypothetical protein